MARIRVRSAGGRNSSVSTPLRSTVTLSSGAPSATSACFKAALTAIRALASRMAPWISRRGMAIARDQIDVGAAGGDHHGQPEALADPGGGDAVGIDVMRVDRVEAMALGEQARDPRQHGAIQQPGRRRHAEFRESPDSVGVRWRCRGGSRSPARRRSAPSRRSGRSGWETTAPARAPRWWPDHWRADAAGGFPRKCRGSAAPRGETASRRSAGGRPEVPLAVPLRWGPAWSSRARRFRTRPPVAPRSGAFRHVVEQFLRLGLFLEVGLVPDDGFELLFRFVLVAGVLQGDAVVVKNSRIVAVLPAGLAEQCDAALRIARRGQNPAQRIGGLRAG